MGCLETDRRGKGSHRLWTNPASGKGAIIPDWGRKDLKIGTLRNAVRQLGLDWQEFKS